ncbi:branched-chain amino acid ABC transporter permease (plasmid) [Burkholderia sp. SFA1]|uniref:branched-chain amino acid ABC transporter permease n=1 Tax=unclassified Caballeronia TaxID=2646786 RepID=UPI001F281323|nr:MULTISPECIES: branched-chain amino acid ABC transporter permease [unclassified Caballeronia]MCE4546960.1 branched-chain amino acid ABC transporter permease [Caballeronia sp. PC1]MCE4572567.1 branched-chain amino acid ABC transporter permease [Caballeronia sp. CLC5]BBQ02060.1 branched-chain amino acid ABC transporter permease [Burkholderia sp. SFA1]
MQTLFQLMLTALQIGSVYVLFALGLTLIFGVLRIVNFAHGQFFTLSALIVSVAIPWLVARGVPVQLAYLGAFVAGVVLASGLGAIVFRFAFRRFQRDLAGSFILSAGFVLLFEGIFREVFGGAVRSVPPLVSGNVEMFGATLAAQRLILCGVAVALAGALLWSLNATRMGRAMRAVSIDHEAAMLQGIPYNAIAFRGFVVATALGAIAGALIAPVSIVSPEFGESYLVKGFIAVVIGGLGSVPGAILGSVFIALIESFGGFYFDPSSANLAIFVLVMLVLLVRPKGVLGHA